MNLSTRNSFPNFGDVPWKRRLRKTMWAEPKPPPTAGSSSLSRERVNSSKKRGSVVLPQIMKLFLGVNV